MEIRTAARDWILECLRRAKAGDRDAAIELLKAAARALPGGQWEGLAPPELGAWLAGATARIEDGESPVKALSLGRGRGRPGRVPKGREWYEWLEALALEGEAQEALESKVNRDDEHVANRDDALAAAGKSIKRSERTVRRRIARAKSGR